MRFRAAYLTMRYLSGIFVYSARVFILSAIALAGISMLIYFAVVAIREWMSKA